MKTISLLSTLSIFSQIAFAAPASEGQIVLGGFSDFGNSILDGVEQLKDLIQESQSGIQEWINEGKTFLKENGLTYELVQHPQFTDYRLKITEPTLCDPTVKQYSGYFDISDDKHLFFWFFESRSSPSDDPLLMWLNGGPGCSSSTGLLFELGPCNIAEDGRNTTFNPYSWNNVANMIFLDQPVNTGFSYSDNGAQVDNSPVAGKDVYAFLQLFLTRFPEYANKPFHLAAESYGGTYAPHIANVIYTENKELSLTSDLSLVKINLASIILANGMTDNYIQMASIPDYLCEGPFPIYDDPQGPQCAALRSKVPTCQRLIQSCRDFNSRLTCVPAVLYCNSQLYGAIQQSGLNPYDARVRCAPEDGSLCYKQMKWIETWMNTPEVKTAVGANTAKTFESCNMAVNQAFTLQGDSMHDTKALLTDLVNDGVKLLVYAGNADMMCNYMGNERWVLELDSKFHDEFVSTPSMPWATVESGSVAGMVRSAGGGGSTAGNVTFVTVHDAGHMVPYDQPEAALDLITRWLLDVPLA